ncbi:murein L,D-transpeptidase YcbB/YkuD [Mucilaginibacter sp. UYP25]|uniref:L,D-transpeptidase family protein n=1 Tax=unclassified Mucilaginibacter TaxID=2617802 RepID=UPI0033915FBC
MAHLRSQLNRLTWLTVALICSTSYSGCSQEVKKTPKTDSLKHDWDKTIPGNFSGQSKTVFDSTRIASFFKRYPAVKTYEPELRTFYRQRKYAYAWFDDGQLIEQASNLANRVMNLENDGIYKAVPYQQALDSLLHDQGGKGKDIQQDVSTELMLTTQYFVFAKLAWRGMNTATSKSSGWFMPRKKIAYPQYLDSLLKEPADNRSTTEPVYRQYDLLRGFLRKYRALDQKDQWLPIILTKNNLKNGDSSDVIRLLKARLFKLEDYYGDTLSAVYTEELLTALKVFQERHGLLVSGLPDKATLAGLNVPLASRIKQILVNMERSRWLPVKLNSDYLAVNIPEYQLHVYHADSLLWSCKVVVGQTVHPTTVFYGEVKQVVFSPYWNLPRGITRNEVLPGIRKNTRYIAEHRMEITGTQNGLPVIRQKPGPENSLGLVKFLFPNSYNIYLHDTPSKSLFGETSRGFSHGCIRVSEPAKLADFLLKSNGDWDAEKIKAAMHGGKERYINLTQKVPVFIAYFTAFTDRDNRLNFRKDIYQLDARLAAMILSGNGAY